MIGFKRLMAVFAGVAMLAILVGCGGKAPSLEGSEWKLADWSAADSAADEFDITLAFDDGKLAGQAPVNSYGADVELGSDGSFKPGDINRTLMAGSDAQNAAEERYLTLLDQADKYRVEGNRLILSSGEGDLLTFERQ